MNTLLDVLIQPTLALLMIVLILAIVGAAASAAALTAFSAPRTALGERPRDPRSPESGPLHMARAHPASAGGAEPGPPVLATERTRRQPGDVYLNILLYVGGLLIVAAAAAMVVTAVDVRTVPWILGGATAVFSAVGFVLHSSVQRLRPVGIAFIGTALAVVPFVGIAAGILHPEDARLAWLITSAAGGALYLTAAIRLTSRIVSWLAIGYLFSTVLSGVSFATTALAWHLAAIIVMSTVVQAVLLRRRSTPATIDVLTGPAAMITTFLPYLAALTLVFAWPSAVDVIVVALAASIHFAFRVLRLHDAVASAGLRLSIPLLLTAGATWFCRDSPIAPLPGLGLLLSAIILGSGLIITVLASTTLLRLPVDASGRVRRVQHLWAGIGVAAIVLAALVVRMESSSRPFGLPPHSLLQLAIAVLITIAAAVTLFWLAHRHRHLLPVLFGAALLAPLPFSVSASRALADDSGTLAGIGYLLLVVAAIAARPMITSPRAEVIAASFAGGYAVLGSFSLVVAESAIDGVVIGLTAAFLVALSVGTVWHRSPALLWASPVLLGCLTLKTLLWMTEDGRDLVIIAVCLVATSAALEGVLLLAIRRSASAVWSLATILVLRASTALPVLGSLVIVTDISPAWVGLCMIVLGTLVTLAILRMLPETAVPGDGAERGGDPPQRVLLVALSGVTGAVPMFLAGMSTWSPAALLVAVTALAAALHLALRHRILIQWFAVIIATVALCRVLASLILGEDSTWRSVVAPFAAWAILYAMSMLIRRLELADRLEPGLRTVAHRHRGARQVAVVAIPLPPGIAPSGPLPPRPAAPGMMSPPRGMASVPGAAAAMGFPHPPRPPEFIEHRRRTPGVLTSPRTMILFSASILMLLQVPFGLDDWGSGDGTVRYPFLLTAGLCLIGIAMMLGLEGLPRSGVPARLILLEPAAYLAALGVLSVLAGLTPVHTLVTVNVMAIVVFGMAVLIARTSGTGLRTEARWLTAMGLLSLTGAIYALAEEAAWVTIVFVVDHLALLVVGVLLRRAAMVWWGLVAIALGVVFGLRELGWISLLALGLFVIGIVIWQLLRPRGNTGTQGPGLRPEDHPGPNPSAEQPTGFGLDHPAFAPPSAGLPPDATGHQHEVSEQHGAGAEEVAGMSGDLSRWAPSVHQGQSPSAPHHSPSRPSGSGSAPAPSITSSSPFEHRRGDPASPVQAADSAGDTNTAAASEAAPPSGVVASRVAAVTPGSASEEPRTDAASTTEPTPESGLAAAEADASPPEVEAEDARSDAAPSAPGLARPPESTVRSSDAPTGYDVEPTAEGEPADPHASEPANDHAEAQDTHAEDHPASEHEQLPWPQGPPPGQQPATGYEHEQLPWPQCPPPGQQPPPGWQHPPGPQPPAAWPPPAAPAPEWQAWAPAPHAGHRPPPGHVPPPAWQVPVGRPLPGTWPPQMAQPWPAAPPMIPPRPPLAPPAGHGWPPPHPTPTGGSAPMPMAWGPYGAPPPPMPDAAWPGGPSAPPVTPGGVPSGIAPHPSPSEPGHGQPTAPPETPDPDRTRHATGQWGATHAPDPWSPHPRADADGAVPPRAHGEPEA